MIPLLQNTITVRKKILKEWATNMGRAARALISTAMPPRNMIMAPKTSHRGRGKIPSHSLPTSWAVLGQALERPSSLPEVNRSLPIKMRAATNMAPKKRHKHPRKVRSIIIVLSRIVIPAAPHMAMVPPVARVTSTANRILIVMEPQAFHQGRKNIYMTAAKPRRVKVRVLRQCSSTATAQPVTATGRVTVTLTVLTCRPPRS
jgi:hypothetical protein